MIKFKALKYKHYKRAQAIYDDLDKDSVDDVVKFAVGLVKEWDFVDADTGEPFTPGEEAVDELSLEQFKELFRVFNRKMGFDVRLADDVSADTEAETGVEADVSEAKVPKENAEHSPSG